MFPSAAKQLVFLSICALTSSLGAPNRAGIANDLSHRDPSIHWPEAFNPRVAPVFAHNELMIQAGCHRVWTRLLDVTDWPNWFVLTKDVAIDSSDKTVKHGTLIRLEIFGSPITSRIDEYVADSRLSWFPQGLDETAPSHYHTWRFVPEALGCRVITEETGIGPNDARNPASSSRLVHRAHDLWLASLRFTSEQ